MRSSLSLSSLVAIAVLTAACGSTSPGSPLAPSASVSPSSAIGSSAPSAPSTPSAANPTPAPAAASYCGAYDGPMQGALSFAATESTVDGWADNNGERFTVSGTVAESSVDFRFMTASARESHASGGLADGMYSGTWTDTDGNSGPWQAASCR